MKKFLLMTLLLILIPTVAYGAQAKTSTDTGYLGNDQWIIDSDGDMVPASDSAQDIGASESEVDNIYTDGLILGGVEKNSWGSIVSPMTDASGYVYPTDSGGVYRMYDAGYLALGAGTAVDTYILFDTDDDDFYFGRDDTDNDCAWGVGSTLGADERITVVDSAVLTHIVIGDGVDAEDKYLLFDGNLGDQYIGYLDTYDMLIAGDGATMDADMCWGVENASTPLLVLWNGIDGYGAIDLDYGSADITDHTFVSDGGTTIIDGQITLGGATNHSEVISNETDDTIRVASNDLDTILEVYTPYDTTGDATLKLTADLGDAVKEQWTMTNNGDGNDLTFGCDTGSSGTPVTKLTLDEDGVITTIAAINAEIDNSANTTVTDVVNIQHFTSGTAAAGIGVGLTFDIENAAGTEEEHASIDVVSAVATNGSEDTDFVVNLMTNGALAEIFRIDNDNEADAGAVFELTSFTEETNGVIDMLELTLDNSLDTSNDGMGLGISILMDDETDAVEQQASMDFVLTDVTTTAENVDFILSLNTIGTIREVFKIDTDNTATDNTLFQLTSWTLQTDAVQDVLELILDNTADTAVDNFGLGISIGMEDETDTAEQQASIDFVLTDAGSTTEDCDIVFSQNIAGAIEERVRFDADDDTILLTGTLPKMTIGDGGDEDAILTFDGQTNDFYMGFDTTDDLLNIGVGSTPGTTCAIEIDASANVIITSSMKIPYQIHAVADTLTINEGHKLHVFDNATEYKLTLPSAASSAGIHWHIVLNLAPSGTSYTIGTHGGENLFFGVATVNGAVVGCQAQDLITFTLDAAVIGDYVDLYCDGVKWYVSGTAFAATGIAFGVT